MAEVRDGQTYVNGVLVDPTKVEYGWTVPDVFEEGIPCACASLLACYFRGDAGSVYSWVINLGHRLWLPAMWDEHIDPTNVCEHLDGIAAFCAEALVLAGDSYETYRQTSRADDADDKVMVSPWYRLMRRICDVMEPEVLGHPQYPQVSITSVQLACGPSDELCDTALALRYLWLARLHEVTHRWDPALDWAETRTYLHSVGIADDQSSVWADECARRLASAFSSHQAS